MAQKSQNLLSYYKSLERPYKSKFIRNVAAQCNISSAAVLKWVFRDCNPSRKQYIDILAKETGISPENLFNRNLDDEEC